MSTLKRRPSPGPSTESTHTMRRYFDQTPYFTTARFDSTCPETGSDIKKGDRIAYFPASRTAYCENSKAADQVRGLEFAASWGMADADY